MTDAAVPSDGSGPQTGEVVREEFGARELAVTAETSSTAVAEQAKAAIQARYIMAIQRPRDLDEVRQKLLKECRRTGFARVARYRKPIGRGVEGPSIRFAEAALRAMGNVLPEVSTLWDDATKRIVRVSVTDLEVNLTYSKDVVIQKTVERRNLDGKTPLSSRKNSSGHTVYTVEAGDDDILNKENALISKAIRTNGLRLLPGDILDECMELVQETLRAGVEADPDAERKRLVDAFSGLGVKAPALKAYLGHDLDESSPAELIELRALYSAIRDGEATWAEAMDSKAPSNGKEKDPKVEALREKLEKRKAAKAGATPEPEQSAPEDGPEKEELDADGNCLRCERGSKVLKDFGHGDECA